MRPKRRILLIDSNVDRQGVWRFLFKTHAYAVFSATTAAEALDLAAHMDRDPDVIVAAYPFGNPRVGDPGLTTILGQVRAIAPYAPSIVLAHRSDAALAEVVADAILTKSVSIAEFLERVKVVCTRRHGPRKGTPYHSKYVQSVGVAAAEVRRIA